MLFPVSLSPIMGSVGALTSVISVAQCRARHTVGAQRLLAKDAKNDWRRRTQPTIKHSATESLLLSDGVPDARDRKTNSTQNCSQWKHISKTNTQRSEWLMWLLLRFSDPSEELRLRTHVPV